MVDTSQLIKEAEKLFHNGEHHDAVDKLATAAKSEPNEEQQSSIEKMIGKIGEHVVGNSEEAKEGEDKARGSGDSGSGGLVNKLMSVLSSNSQGSPQAQLGKLALLSTIMKSSGGNSGGFNLSSIKNMLSGDSSSGGGSGLSASGLASLASNVFGGKQGQESSSGGGLSSLSSMAGNFLNSGKK
ncbi:prion domain-containing protein RNQ1 Ecym_1053 [Eremothecium cymbalariae DBVPG|uniref:Uncharacterized protein n=1 Tax=Eremothecium cymbalariae (strain CBS 270.75 / DBVPG 7215 / KCTC 17166 / NRRL Y-17582) TaxID=931890 RepID=G8JMA2_ERECY|nr:hypothetical protein Ecym_1053 [Eremothecium cymbalariae DBVPG\